MRGFPKEKKKGRKGGRNKKRTFRVQTKQENVIYWESEGFGEPSEVKS